MSAIRTVLEFDFRIFNANRPKALVISHERSGTHFLMNSLEANFGYVAAPFVNLDLSLGVNYHSSVAFNELFAKFEKHDIANIFKSHHTLDFYRDFLPSNPLGFKVLYIYRDVYEVQVSYHRHLMGLPWYEGLGTRSFSEFLRQSPEGAMTRYQFHHASSMVERWVQHIESALAARTLFSPTSFMMVEYNQLNQRFENTIEQMARFLDTPCPTVFSRPSNTRNVVPPILGLAQQRILDYYTPDDTEFVEKVAGPTRRKLSELSLQWT
jgi:hypothetical protein